MRGGGADSWLRHPERPEETDEPDELLLAGGVQRVALKWKTPIKAAALAGLFVVSAGALLCLGSQGRTPPKLRGGELLEGIGFCGRVEADVEFHTRISLTATGPVYSAEQCCAVCDGHPDCSAWSWGKRGGIEGLSQICHLRALSSGEEVTRTVRKGIVSGLLAHRLQKHGVIAGMLLDEERLAGASNKSVELRPVEANETCRGRVDFKGHGNFSVINAKFDNPVSRASAADVLGHWGISATMRSRVYLAESCTQGCFKHSEYAALHLLGRTLSYKVDLSGLGCGCDALLQLVPMRQNPWESTCHDYYCSPSKICGVPCTEIQVQSANQYSWVTSVHAHDDEAGLAVGYSGGTSWVGNRDWNSSHYAPGSKCIDTSWPFEVTVAFPVTSDGQLERVEVRLAQGDCHVSAQVDDYTFRGRNGLGEISAVLKAGVTPVISYWKSSKMMWLDGPGTDGKGPCIEDAPDACPASFHIFDFAVDNISAGKLQSALKPVSLFSEALHAMHETSEGEAKTLRQEQLARLTASKDLGTLKKDCEVDCSTNGTLQLNLTYNKEFKPVVVEGSHEERRDNNLEWEVVADKALVQELSGTPVGGWKFKKDVVTGKRQENFLKLSFEDGYIAISKDSTQILRPRRVSYVLITTGTCSDHGLHPIHSSHICEAAGFSLGYFDPRVEVYTGDKPRPEGCHIIEGELAVSLGPASRGRGVHGLQRPICSSLSYPSVTLTTTTITSSTGTTATSTTSTTQQWTTTTSTTWGTPSLFCFLAMQVTGDSGEMELVKVQLKSAVGIFLCDEYAVFTENVSLDLGTGPTGDAVKSIAFEPAKVWVNHAGEKATVCVFVHVWEALKRDGRYSRLQWTVKVDPDTVIVPWRIRRHLGPHTGPAHYLVTNEMREQDKPDPSAPLVDHALEAYSNKALKVYLEHGYKCMTALKWQQWTEEYYMERCLHHLGVDQVKDTIILQDKKRKGFATCKDTNTAAFHNFKDPSSWLACWTQTVR